MKSCYSVSTPTNRNVTWILCVISEFYSKEIGKILHRYMISYFVWGDIKWISDFYSKKLEKYYTDIWFLTLYEDTPNEHQTFIQRN